MHLNANSVARLILVARLIVWFDGFVCFHLAPTQLLLSCGHGYETETCMQFEE